MESNKNTNNEHKKFIEHLKKVSKQVELWPEWKKRVMDLTTYK